MFEIYKLDWKYFSENIYSFRKKIASHKRQSGFRCRPYFLLKCFKSFNFLSAFKDLYSFILTQIEEDLPSIIQLPLTYKLMTGHYTNPWMGARLMWSFIIKFAKLRIIYSLLLVKFSISFCISNFKVQRKFMLSIKNCD